MSSVVQAPYGRRSHRRRPHATFLYLAIAALASSPLVAGLHLDLEEQVSIASQANAYLSRAEASSRLATRGLIDDADNYLEQAKSQFIDAFIEEVAKYKEEAYKAKQMAEREMQEELRKMEEEAKKKSTEESARRQDMVEKMNREGDEMKKMLDELKDMPVALEAIASRSSASDATDSSHLSFSGGGRKQNMEPPLPKESPKEPPPQHSAPSGDASNKALFEADSTTRFPMLQLPAASAVALAEASNLLVPAAIAATLSVPAGSAAQMAAQKAASDTAAAQMAAQKVSDGLLTPPLAIGATGVNVNSPPWVLRDSSLLAVAAPANAAS